MGNAEEIEEKLSSKLSVIALETSSLQEEKVHLSKEVDNLGRQVMALRTRLGQAEAATRLRQEQAEVIELEEKGEMLDSLLGGRRELKMRTLAEKSMGEMQALLREAIRNTRSEGLLLENELKSLRHERKTKDGSPMPKQAEFPEVKSILEKQAELEREHLSEFCLAAENSAALDASMKRLEKMLERKLEAEAALNMPFCREVAVQKKQDDVESAPKSPKLRAACPEALKKLAYLTEEVNSKEGEVLASLSSLQMVVADDRERLLLRQELPDRILDLKSELECLKQGVAEERELFIQFVEKEKAKLREEEVNLNIKLAARNMIKEKNKASAVQGEVVVSDSDVEGCSKGGEGEEKEILVNLPSEQIHVEVREVGEEQQESELASSKDIGERESENEKIDE